MAAINNGMSWTTVSVSLNSRWSDSARNFHLDDLAGSPFPPGTGVTGTLSCMNQILFSVQGALCLGNTSHKPRSL